VKWLLSRFRKSEPPRGGRHRLGAPQEAPPPPPTRTLPDPPTVPFERPVWPVRAYGNVPRVYPDPDGGDILSREEVREYRVNTATLIHTGRLREWQERPVHKRAGRFPY